MKKLLLIAALPLLFSACKQPEPPASVTDAAPEPATTLVQRDDLPKGLALDVPYTVVSDEWVEEESERKRKVVVEFQKATTASVGEAVTNSMIAARYRPTGQSEARGGVRFNFRADEGVRASILVRPRGFVKLQNPESTGNLEFSYTEPRDSDAPLGEGGSGQAQAMN